MKKKKNMKEIRTEEKEDKVVKRKKNMRRKRNENKRGERRTQRKIDFLE